MKKILTLMVSHVAVAVLGFGAGVYFLPILTAPPAPDIAVVRDQATVAEFTGQFRRELADSDAVHWGDGTVFLSREAIVLDGRIAPGPDYKLYLSPVFVETEDDFLRLKREMTLIGDVKTFENFIVPLSSFVDLSRFNTVIVWCESFSQFITAAQYR
ncbi:MAG: DM13 domain-containing protein [Gammaproteobacteria bacterium]|nr:DM13 domain-containing protein [Gammaproteobacteria bacterium]